MTTAKPIDTDSIENETRDRFWAKVTPTGFCWNWDGWRKASGYGGFSAVGRNFPAHRMSYALLVGDADPLLDLDHLCRNRACVNPDHLEPVTRKQNLARGTGHGSETECPSGHPYTPENVYLDAGGRKCRTCVLIRAKARYRGSRAQ